MRKIVITPRGYTTYGQEHKKQLEQLGFQVILNDTGEPFSSETFLNYAKDAEGIIVGVDTMDGDLLRQCSKLKAIVKFGVGTDNIDLAVCEELGIKVGRCLGTNTNAVAEFTIGLMFNSARNIADNAQNVTKGNWVKPTGSELYGKKLGIVGFGMIGKTVAERANGLGMKVSAFDVCPIPTEELRKYAAVQEELDELLSSCDFITIHVPYLETTKNLIDQSALDRMKSSCILINTARGGIVDEYALFKILKDGKIAAASSDVFLEEPPLLEDWRSELFQLPNFTPTAHIASRSKEAEMNTVQCATDLIINYLV